jgi:hypothetical protein
VCVCKSSFCSSSSSFISIFIARGLLSKTG